MKSMSAVVRTILETYIRAKRFVSKKIRRDQGDLEIQAPWYRDGIFNPIIVPKRKNMIDGMEGVRCAMCMDLTFLNRRFLGLLTVWLVMRLAGRIAFV